MKKGEPFLINTILLLEKYVVKYLTLLLGKSLIFREHTPRPGTPCIYLFWHRNIIPLMYLYRNQQVIIIISQSRDGEIIAGPVELMGYKTVRGSSTRGGTEALYQLVKSAGNQSIAVTPDGPVGPREVMKKSVLFIAYHTKLPLIPMAVDIDREWLFPTWDLFRVPKPKGVVNISYGNPYYVKDKDNLDKQLADLQFEMDRLQFMNREWGIVRKQGS
jgi:hypothetical protein